MKDISTKLDSIQKELDFIRKTLTKAKIDLPSKSDNVKDRIKDFKSACEYLNIKTHGDAFKLLKLKRTLLSEIPIEQCEDTELKLMIGIYALNEGWIPDMKNTSEYKYFPYFEIKDSGFRFLRTHYLSWHVVCPSRLAFKSTDLSDYSAEIFFDLYKEILFY